MWAACSSEIPGRHMHQDSHGHIATHIVLKEDLLPMNQALAAEIDRQPAMDALPYRQEGRAVGMIRFAAARAFNDCRHGDDDAEQQDPEAKQPGQHPRGCL